ncbi:MAG: (Fe-S)-binding protein [Bacteroidetes bacterium]|nr:(Fe-S)-binding protein [Bacteroidota bacterium]MBU1114756.1 (Fe-S)-binding protein [Bacteroidota bacterium]MBU1797779.1 (Fe-S)-binding protein [Bacteroidota bacterium]
MDVKNLIFTVIFIGAFSYLFYSLRKKYQLIKLGKDENRFKNPNERLFNVFKIVFGQSKLLRDPIAGTVHFFIFWGFVLFTLAVLESIIQGFYSNFNLKFLGKFYNIVSFTHDVFAVLVIIAIIVALFRRYFLNIERLPKGKHEKFDATFILLMIFAVVITMLGQNSAHLAINDFQFSEFEYRPISMLLSSIFYTSGSNVAPITYEIFWWLHILVVFSFMNYLPYSKHFHVYTSIPNVYFSKLPNEKMVLKSINLEDEDAEQFGVADIEHLTWKQILDGYACTECGRCTAVCPAAITGKPLSPREIIVNVRKRVEEKGPFLLNNSESEGITDKTLIHDFIKPEELWACTTCGACVHECPVTIEHVDTILDMRQNLVLMESQFPSELNNLFKNLETNFSPWAFNQQDRANWAEGLNIKTLAEDSEGEILFWVGCSGSFDTRYQKVSQAFSKIMQKAGVDFRILGTEEKCNGDTARRLGNEYLAQTLMQENIETLNNYKVKKIVTACPHCFNSIKNDYPNFGGKYEVLHHTEFIDNLIKSNKISLKKDVEVQKLTYHDSCYLGRYNSIYEQPRHALESIGSVKIIEPERSKDKGFCCGAGGGRMFLEENTGTRINEERTKELIKTGAETIASACPFCMTMLNDGLKAEEKNEEIEVKDIAEIILEQIK